MKRLLCVPALLGLLILSHTEAWAQVAATAPASKPASAPTSKPAASKAASRPTAEQAVDARAWVHKPRVEQTIDAYGPAADIRFLEYDKPRPQRVWIAKINLAAPGVRCTMTEPAQFQGDDARFETRCATPLEFAQQTGVQFAFNTSAFSPFRARMGQPMYVIGLAANDGHAYSEAEKDYGAMYISRAGRVSLSGPPLPREDVWDVVPGFRMLLDDGAIVVSDEEANSDFGNVNPRTAVGVDKDGATLWVVVADGRQKNVASGWTLVEMACLFESLGCWDALNLDGGGSSTFVLEDALGEARVMNTPVGNKIPGTLREVAHCVGFYLPGPRIAAGTQPADDIRSAITRAIARPLQQSHAADADDALYAGKSINEILRESAPHADCASTLKLVLSAYRSTIYADLCTDNSRWLANMPLVSFQAFTAMWFGKEPGGLLADAPPIPQNIDDRQAVAALAWANLATIEPDWRGCRRGDILHFERRDGSTQTGIYWRHDRDDEWRVRIWYWSACAARNAGRVAPDDAPAGLAGHLTWERIGDEINPARFFAGIWITPADTAAESQPSASQPAASKPTAKSAVTRPAASRPVSSRPTAPASLPATSPAAPARGTASSGPGKRSLNGQSPTEKKGLPRPAPQRTTQPADAPASRPAIP